MKRWIAWHLNALATRLGIQRLRKWSHAVYPSPFVRFGPELTMNVVYRLVNSSMKRWMGTALRAATEEYNWFSSPPKEDTT